MALTVPVSLRGNTYTVPSNDVVPVRDEVQPDAPVPDTGAVRPADSVESTEDARLRLAQDAAIGNLSAPQRGVQAARTLDEVRVGIDERNMRLDRANRAVERLETGLAQQLMNLSPALSQEERQAYADAYRARNSGPYGEARDAAQELADYTRENLPRVEQAARDLPGHPHPNAVSGMVTAVARSMEQSMGVLDTAVRQSPTGSTELQSSLEQLGTQFAQVAERAAAANGDPGNQQAPGFDATRPTVGGLGVAVGQLSRTAGSLAQRAAGKFGVVGGVLGAVDAGGRIADGTARAEHYAGAGAGLAMVVGGVLRIGGVAVGGPISLIAGGASMLATAASAVRDRNAYVRDVTATLQATGMDAARAEALARSNPESLRLLEGAGYTPDQIRDVVGTAPVTTRIHASSTETLVRAGQQLGVSPERMTEIVRQLGARDADVAIAQLQRALSLAPGLGSAGVMQELESGWGATDASRRLAALLRG